MGKQLLILLYGCIFICPVVVGQQDPSIRRLHYRIEFQDLYTTHADHFRGASLIISKSLSPVFSLGISAEFSGAASHPDNGWNLYQLRFLPVCIDEQFKLSKQSKIYPVIHFAQGISFIRYLKETPALPGIKQFIKETGLYAYGGAGLVWQLSHRLSLLAEAGLKGFHLSTNNLDINPHGVVFRAGIIL